MNHAKKSLTIPLIILSVLVGIELIAIIVLSVLTTQISRRLSVESGDLYDYCLIEEADDEICDKYFDEARTDYDISYVDPELYGDVFLSTYANIKNGRPISEDDFYSFVSLSEYYTDNHITTAISGENIPSTYFASSSRDRERENYAYPYGVVRRISLEIPNEGCAVFDFFPNFSYLYKYTLEIEESCNESN